MTLMKLNHRPASKFFDQGIENWISEFEKNFNQGLNASSNVPANIVETEEGYHLELLAAGRDKNNFKVAVEEKNLVVSYEKAQSKEDEPKLKYVRKEFGNKSFKRSFYLAELVNVDDIQAKYEDGILKIFLPKKAEAKPVARQINIQ